MFTVIFFIATSIFLVINAVLMLVFNLEASFIFGVQSLILTLLGVSYWAKNHGTQTNSKGVTIDVVNAFAVAVAISAVVGPWVSGTETDDNKNWIYFLVSLLGLVFLSLEAWSHKVKKIARSVNVSETTIIETNSEKRIITVIKKAEVPDVASTDNLDLEKQPSMNKKVKLELKKIITEVPLHCIASFVVGAYTILLINYFWFNNNITPPGVSAFIAGMALLFTIYAAFKVKEWSEQKMNDKAFKHAEEIIELLNKCYRDFSVGSSMLVLLAKNENGTTISNNHLLITEYKDRRKEYQFKVPEILNMIETLAIWKFSTPYLADFEAFVDKIGNFDMKATKALNELSKDDAESTKRFMLFHHNLELLKYEVVTEYKKFTKLSFDEIFLPVEKK